MGVKISWHGSFETVYGKSVPTVNPTLYPVVSPTIDPSVSGNYVWSTIHTNHNCRGYASPESDLNPGSQASIGDCQEECALYTYMAYWENGICRCYHDCSNGESTSPDYPNTVQEKNAAFDTPSSYENLGVGFCTGDINLPFIKMPNTYEGSENSDNECRNLCNQNVECLGYNYSSNRRYCNLWAAEGTVFASGTPTGYTHVTIAGSGTRITAAHYDGSSDNTQCMRKRIEEVQFESEKSEVLEEVLLEKPTLNVIMAALAMVGLFAFISTLNKVICKRSEYQPVIEEQEI